MFIFKVTRFEQSNGTLLAIVSSNDLPDITSPDADLKKVLVLDWDYSDFINTILYLRQVADRSSAAFSSTLPIDLYAEWREITWRVTRIRYCSTTGALTLELI